MDSWASQKGFLLFSNISRPDFAIFIAQLPRWRPCPGSGSSRCHARGIPRFGRPGRDASNVSGQRREAVLFDLDGVIASSEAISPKPMFKRSSNSVELRHRNSRSYSGKFIGLSYEETRDRYLECGKIAATTEIREAYRSLYSSIYRSKLQEVELSPGARNLIETLAGRRYRIGSSALHTRRK